MNILEHWATESLAAVRGVVVYRDNDKGVMLVRTHKVGAMESRQRFTVIYGKQVDKDLDYAVAARKLGECIMHAVACTGAID